MSDNKYHDKDYEAADQWNRETFGDDVWGFRKRDLIRQAFNAGRDYALKESGDTPTFEYTVNRLAMMMGGKYTRTSPETGATAPKGVSEEPEGQGPPKSHPSAPDDWKDRATTLLRQSAERLRKDEAEQRRRISGTPIRHQHLLARMLADADELSDLAFGMELLIYEAGQDPAEPETDVPADSAWQPEEMDWRTMDRAVVYPAGTVLLSGDIVPIPNFEATPEALAWKEDHAITQGTLERALEGVPPDVPTVQIDPVPLTQAKLEVGSVRDFVWCGPAAGWVQCGAKSEPDYSGYLQQPNTRRPHCEGLESE